MSTVRAAALLARYADCGATLGDVAGMQTGVSVPGAADSSHWLAELTPIARVLLLGAGAASALRAAGLPAPALLGMVATALAGVAQIAPGQYLVSASASSPHAVPVLEGSSNWLVLPIEYAEFALGGPNITELIAEICTADATAPSATAWFPTQLCGLDAVLVRALDGWHVLCAPAEAPWLGGVLLGLIESLDGGLIGYNDYLTLSSQNAEEHSQ